MNTIHPDPRWPLSDPHLQTICSSTWRRLKLRKSTDVFQRNASREVIDVLGGIRLEVWRNHAGPNAPAVGILHGWLGSAQSGYVLSAAMRLQQAGFNVVRINLRDHGDTAGLNEELFNSARISEVIALVQQLAAGYTDFGLMGFSLGGNFALRVARATKVPTLAICPAIDPALTMKCIDSGLAVYRLYFLHKWRRALAAKAAAFPRAYDFTEAFGLRSVQTLTDLFVNRFSEFSTTAEYFSHYDLRLDALAGVDAMVVATQDDPVVPAAQFAGLPASLAIDLVATGGHCALLKNWRLESYCDDVAERFFRDRLLT